MTNWKALVAARGLDISDEELDRIQPMLDKLESVFEPLTARIPFGTEPVIVLRCNPQDEDIDDE
jgi:hypothetical protein